MAFSIKKRYARATRFRKIMSNNLSVQQTRRDPLADPSQNNVIGGTSFAQLVLNKPCIVPSNAVAITGVVDNFGHKPIAVERPAPNIVNFIFVSGAVTALHVPFEDGAVRGQVGEYLAPGNYVEGG